MSGLYNMVFGTNPATMLLAPMLTSENPWEYFPRFRDCYEEDGNIVIYTRVGGGNRTYLPEPPYGPLYDDGDWQMEYSFGEVKLYEMPTFIRTYDDDFDSTYGYYVFGVPEEWKDDFDKVMSGDLKDVSQEYLDRIAECFDVGPLERGTLADIKFDASRLSEAPDWDAFFAKLKEGPDGAA